MARKNKADTQEIEVEAKKSRPNSRGRTSAKAQREKEEKEKAEKQRKLEQARRRNQHISLLLLALSVLLFAFVIVKGENVWLYCHNVCMGLFGGWAVLWPVLLCITAILLAFNKLEAKNVRAKLILVTLVIFSACTTVFTYSNIQFTPGLGYIDKLYFLYDNGVKTSASGLCSGILGVPLIELFGELGARIFSTILLAVLGIFFSGLTLNEILSKPAKAAHRVREAGARHYREIRTQRAAEREAYQEDPYDDGYDYPTSTVFSEVGYDDSIYSTEASEELSSKREVKKTSLFDKIKSVFHIEDQPDSDYLDDESDDYEEAPHVRTFSREAKRSIPKSPEQSPERIYAFSDAKKSVPKSPDESRVTTFSPKAKSKIPQIIVRTNDEEDADIINRENTYTEFDEDEPYIPAPESVPEKKAVRSRNYVDDPDELIRNDSEELDNTAADSEPLIEDNTPEDTSEAETHDYVPEQPRVVRRETNTGLTVPLDIEESTLAERQKLAEQALAEREETERQDMADRAQMALYNNQKNDPNTYIFPPVTMLKASDKLDTDAEVKELQSRGQKLVDILKSFGVSVSIAGFSRGPSVTRYELTPAPGVKVSKITGLSDDIALNLAATGVRIEAPIPGKAAVGIEVPNEHISVVKMRELIESNAFMTAKSKLTVTLGKDISGQVKVADLAKMPHLLIAGTTGSGKSVCINSLIISLIYKSTPDEVKLLMIDPKVVELGIYNGIPHLLVPVVTDPRKAAGALSWAVTEMLNRYKTFAEFNVRDISGYNLLAKTKGYKDDFDQPMLKMPQIVIIIDELADLMMAAPNEVEDSICRLAQMARAAGMHLVVATQRPTVDVVTGLIKANIPSRIAFAVSSAIDSRTILDSQGAEKLLGRGDMLFSPVGAQKPTRIQGCFVTDGEIEDIVGFIKGARQIEYDESINEAIERNAALSGQKNTDKPSGGDDLDDEPENDPVLEEAIKIVTESGQASTSLLQRKLSLGYARAGRYIDKLEQLGIVGPYQGSKPRQVLMTRAQWLERNMQKPDELVKSENSYE